MDQSIGGITNNTHPIIIALSLRLFYTLFGYHSYYIFLINLICWYSGLSLLIIGLYMHFNKRLVILLFIFSYIGNIYDNDLFEIFTNQKTSELRKYLCVNSKKISPCSECETETEYRFINLVN